MKDLAARVIVDTLREGRPTRWTVRGSSMWPAIRDGATVLVTPCDPRAVRAGEFVAYARGGVLVVHRVSAVDVGGLRCRGDALSRDDRAVAWHEVLGRAAVLQQRALTVRWPRPRELSALGRAAVGALRAVLS